MADTLSNKLKTGIKAPFFSLRSTNDEIVSLSDFDQAAALAVLFICNHCPFVKLINEELVKFANEVKASGVECVAINANDAEKYPHDSFKMMKKTAAELNYPFPYLHDETQETAKAYQAACTPDIYLFDAEKRLYYHGRFDDSRPGNNVPVTGKDLRGALAALLNGEKAYEPQVPSIGCNIKWKAGNEPSYFK